MNILRYFPGNRSGSLKNPFLEPGSVRVDKVFIKQGLICPFLGESFANIEEMLRSFDKPDELFIVNYAHGIQAIAHTRDREYIEYKQQLADKFIVQIGKTYGNLTLEEALWCYKEVEKVMESRN
jgi:hypothetical protein